MKSRTRQSRSAERRYGLTVIKALSRYLGDILAKACFDDALLKRLALAPPYGKADGDLGLVGNVTSVYELDDINADIEKNPTWLTCTPAGLITWNNGGTKLETDVKVTSVAKIYNSQIGTFGAEGVVTLLATGKTASK